MSICNEGKHDATLRYIQDAKGPAIVDPLRRAVDRGSEALEFLSKPLILDFLHVKFMCTLPHFAAKRVVHSTINEGFYKYGEGDEYDFKAFWPIFPKKVEMPEKEKTQEKEETQKNDNRWDTWLLWYVEYCVHQLALLAGWHKNERFIDTRT